MTTKGFEDTAASDNLDDDLHAVLRGTLESIAPGVDARSLRGDRPLRDQVDLDSLDWINFIVALEERLHCRIAGSRHPPQATLEELATAITAARTQRDQAADPVPDVPVTLPWRHRLEDGTELTVRPLQAADAPLEAEFVRHLSPGSRYKRFMGTLRDLSPAMLTYLTNVDGVHHVALAAVGMREGHEVLLGVARYVAESEGGGCEFALVLDDALHGSGLAGLLMNLLMQTARAHGLQRMHGLVLAANAPMLKLARQLGFSLHREGEDIGSVRVERPL
jgi:acetyltransferase